MISIIAFRKDVVIRSRYAIHMRIIADHLHCVIWVLCRYDMRLFFRKGLQTLSNLFLQLLLHNFHFQYTIRGARGAFASFANGVQSIVVVANSVIYLFVGTGKKTCWLVL